MENAVERELRAIESALPDSLTPFSKLTQGAVSKSGIGALYVLAAPLLAGGTLTIPHNLRRIPNVCLVLDNPGAYKGDCFFVSKTTTSCVVQFEMALAAGAVVRIV